MSGREGRKATRAHWLNTIVGLLDSSFYLTPEEQFAATRIVTKLLATLNIPDRSTPAVLPMPVVQEVYANYYSTALETTQAGVRRVVRPVDEDDCVTSLEAWRSALESMFISAYPDLTAPERIILAKVIGDLLAAIGVPNRVAAYFPDMVLKAHREIDDN